MFSFVRQVKVDTKIITNTIKLKTPQSNLIKNKQKAETSVAPKL